MIKLHGTSIDIDNNVNLLDNIIPDRNDILNKEDVDRIYNDYILINKELPFLANDIQESYKFQKYKLILHGILLCGSKVTVIINKIKPYMDCFYNSDIDDYKNINRYSNIMKESNIVHHRCKIVTGRDYILYNHEIKKYVRIYFNTLQNRQEMIKVCSKSKIKTYSNAKTMYYRIVARERNINLAYWNTLINYKLVQSNIFKSKYVIEVSVKDINALDTTPYETNDEFNDIKSEYINFDKSILAAFDIEMCPYNTNLFPSGKVPEDQLYMICITFHYVKQVESLLSVCIVSKPCDKQDDMLTIVCRDERTVLLVFSFLIKKFQPEFITEYNGSGFDWVAIVDKCKYYSILPYIIQDMSITTIPDKHLSDLNNEDKLGFYYTEEGNSEGQFKKTIKLGGGNGSFAVARNIKTNGIIPFDTMIVCKQLFPLEDSHKLNAMLAMSNLGSKDDLPIKETFRIFKSGTSSEMAIVAHYCYIDTYKLQQLILNHNVIQDRREVATLSSTSMYDSLYYAGGLKIRNLLMREGTKMGLFFDDNYKIQLTEEEKKYKYPGGLVFPPVRDLVAPNFRLDEFIKKEKIDILNTDLEIMKSFLLKYNEIIYIDRTMQNDDMMKELKELNNYDILIKYIRYIIHNDNRYPVTGLDFSSLYPSLIMTYNLDPSYLVRDENYKNYLESQGETFNKIEFTFNKKNVIAWTLAHNNDSTKYGLAAKVLIDLFNKRANIKKTMHPYEKKIEIMEKEVNNYNQLKEYHDTVFKFNYYNSKQKALKIFMNTIYGELGNNLSCLYALEIAGGVTSMGRYNLRFIKNHVEDKYKAFTWYGDSVVGDTPIIIKYKDQIKLMTIEELQDFLYFNNTYSVDMASKVQVNNKVYYANFNTDIQVLTETGYTPIKLLMRHYTQKKLYRVSTKHGSVIVTEDHSLLDEHKNKITPKDCIKNNNISLLHWNNENENDDRSLLEMLCDVYPSTIFNIPFIYGVLFRSGDYDEKKGWSLTCTNLSVLHKFKSIFEFIYVSSSVVIHKKKHKGFYHANICDTDKVISLIYVNLFYSGIYKKVPDSILNGATEQKISFLQGYYSSRFIKNKHIIWNRGQIGTQGLYLLFHNLNIDVQITTLDKFNINDDPNYTYDNAIYILSLSTEIKKYNTTKVEYLGKCITYVYDIETENHHFAAGIGRLVVHNTDSIYISANKSNFVDLDRNYFSYKITKLEYMTKLIERTFDIVKEYKTSINNALIADNLALFLKVAYEEVLYICCFINKKTYFGIPHKEIINFKPDKLFLRGIKEVRRGVSNILKNISSIILWKAVDINNVLTLQELVIEAVKNCFTTNWSHTDFIKTAVYKPTIQNVSVQTFMQRMRDINYDPLPEANERFKYVISKKFPYKYDELKGNQIALKQGDLWEFPERLIEQNMEIDFLQYFNGEVVGQLVALLTYIPEFNTYIVTDQDKELLTEKEIYIKILTTINKNATKYIEEIALQYSTPFTNKGHVFKQLSKKVKSFISYNQIYDNNTLQLINFTNGSSTNIDSLINELYKSINIIKITTIANKIYNKLCNTYTLNELMKYYSKNKKSVNSIYIQHINLLLNDNITKLTKYINSEKLHDILFNINNSNITNIVSYIKDVYNTQYICDNNLEISSITEYLDDNDIVDVTTNKSLYLNLTNIQYNYLKNIMNRIITYKKIILINTQINSEINYYYNKKNYNIVEPTNLSTNYITLF